MELADLCQVKDVLATVVQVEAEIKRRVGLGLNQAFAVCCLAKTPLNPGSLADELRIHGASLSRVIKSLVQKGYIARDTDDDDARQRVLSLTPLGKRVAADLLGCERALFPVFVREQGLVESR